MRPSLLFAVFIMLAVAAKNGAQDAGAVAAQDPGTGQGVPGTGEIPRDDPGHLRSGFVAMVNGQAITRYELDKKVQAYLRGVQASAEAIRRELPKIRGQVLDEIIIHKLLVQRCDEEEIEPREEQVAAWMQEEIRRQSTLGGSIRNEDDYYQAIREEQGITLDEAKKDVRDQIRILILYYRKVFKDEFVPPRELRAFYDANSDQFSTNDQHKFRQILVPISDPYLKETLEAIETGILDGVPFEKLVEAHSQGPHSDIGGYFDRSDKRIADWPTPLPAEIRKLQPGQTSSKIQTLKGMHYIHLEDRIKGKLLSFEDAQEQIRLRVSQDSRRMQLQRFWKELKRKAIIQVFLEDPTGAPKTGGN